MASTLFKDSANLWIKSANKDLLWKMVDLFFNPEKKKNKQTTKQNQNSTSSDSSMQYCVTFPSVWSKLLHYMEMENSVILNLDIVLNGRHYKNSKNSEHNSMDYIELAYRTGSEWEVICWSADL